MFDINTLGDLTSVGTLAAFAIVCIAVIWLRRTRPDLERGFKVPFYPVTPILGILSCAFLITRVEPEVQLFFLYFLVGAVALYFIYGIWNSKLGKGEVVKGHEPRRWTYRTPKRGFLAPNLNRRRRRRRFCFAARRRQLRKANGITVF